MNASASIPTGPVRTGRPELTWPTWLCALGPLAMTAGLVTLMLHVRFALGHWPEPMREDYRNFAYNAHSLVALWLFAHSLMLAPVSWLVLLCFRITRGSWRFHLAQLAWFIAGWILTQAIWHSDPFRFVTWLKD